MAYMGPTGNNQFGGNGIGGALNVASPAGAMPSAQNQQQAGFQNGLNSLAYSSSQLGSYASYAIDPAILSNAYNTWSNEYQSLQPLVHFDPASLRPATLGVATPNPIRKAKKKKAKIKSNVPVAEVARAIAKHTKTKAKLVNQQTQLMEAKITQEEQVLEDKQKMILSAKNRIAFYNAQKQRLSKTQKEIAKEFEQELEDIKQLDGVQDITLDESGRIIVTTTPLSLQKPDWDEPRVAGVYQLRIDFSEANISTGVRVLNITQRADGKYDSPTISDTFCCWGNIAKDIERDFYTQNITDLVMDMLEYIQSPNEQHGYLGFEGQKNKGWEQFFHAAVANEAGFNWEVYDQENTNDRFEGSFRESPNLEPDLLNNRRINPGVEGGSIYEAINPPPPTNRDTEMMRETLRRLEDERNNLRHELATVHATPQNPYENEVFYALERLGVRAESRSHFFRILIEREAVIESITLRQVARRGYAMLITRQHRNPTRESGGEDEEVMLSEYDIHPRYLDEFRNEYFPTIYLQHNGFIDIIRGNNRLRPMRMNDNSSLLDIDNTISRERYSVPVYLNHREEPRAASPGLAYAWDNALTNATITDITAGGTSTAPDMYFTNAAQISSLQQLAQRNDVLERESQELANRITAEREQLSATQSALPVNSAEGIEGGITLRSINRAINQALGVPGEEESNESNI